MKRLLKIRLLEERCKLEEICSVWGCRLFNHLYGVAIIGKLYKKLYAP